MSNESFKFILDKSVKAYLNSCTAQVLAVMALVVAVIALIIAFHAIVLHQTHKNRYQKPEAINAAISEVTSEIFIANRASLLASTEVSRDFSAMVSERSLACTRISACLCKLSVILVVTRSTCPEMESCSDCLFLSEWLSCADKTTALTFESDSIAGSIRKASSTIDRTIL